MSLLDYCTISLVFLSSEGTFPVAQGYGTVGGMEKRDVLPNEADPSDSVTEKSIAFTAMSWAFVIAWAGFIFFMSSNTGTGLNEGLGVASEVYRVMKDVQAQLLGPGVDALSPLAHFLEYAVFGFLWTNALRCHVPLRRACLMAIICTGLYGATDEFHQLFVPGRMCDPVDWIVDVLGGGLGVGIAYCLIKKAN